MNDDNNLCPLCNQNPVGSDSFHMPIYENKVVNPAETDDWAGMPVCDECYLKQSIESRKTATTVLFGAGDIISVIDKELQWCFDNPDKALTAEYRKGFTNGLIQAKYLIGQMAEAVKGKNP